MAAQVVRAKSIIADSVRCVNLTAVNGGGGGGGGGFNTGFTTAVGALAITDDDGTLSVPCSDIVVAGRALKMYKESNLLASTAPTGTGAATRSIPTIYETRDNGDATTDTPFVIDYRTKLTGLSTGTDTATILIDLKDPLTGPFAGATDILSMSITAMAAWDSIGRDEPLAVAAVVLTETSVSLDPVIQVNVQCTTGNFPSSSDGINVNLRIIAELSYSPVDA